MREVPIRNRFDTLEAQRRTKEFASELGFVRRACHELAIVVSELSSNILKYGKSGRIALVEVHDAEGRGIAVKAYDCGPPFRSVTTALEDGCDDTGPIDLDTLTGREGIGTGLGAVRRLTHGFRVDQERQGKWVVATRYLDKPLPPPER
jgi:anti-sigma regulatory factor (Ser/Thr protein kinase)